MEMFKARAYNFPTLFSPQYEKAYSDYSNSSKNDDPIPDNISLRSIVVNTAPNLIDPNDVEIEKIQLQLLLQQVNYLIEKKNKGDELSKIKPAIENALTALKSLDPSKSSIEDVTEAIRNAKLAYYLNLKYIKELFGFTLIEIGTLSHDIGANPAIALLPRTLEVKFNTTFTQNPEVVLMLNYLDSASRANYPLLQYSVDGMSITPTGFKVTVTVPTEMQKINTFPFSTINPLIYRLDWSYIAIDKILTPK